MSSLTRNYKSLMPKILTSRLGPAKYIFGLVTSVSLLLYGGHSTSIDEESYLAGLRAFLHGQSFIDLDHVNLNGVLYMPGKYGKPTIFYGFGTTIFNLPFYFIGKCLSLLFAPTYQEQVLRLFLYSANSIALGITSVLIYKTCLILKCNLQISTWSSLTFAFCTFALSSAGTGFSEPLTAMFLLAAVYFVIGVSNRKSTIGGLLLGCAILMRSSALLFLPIFFVYLIRPKGFNLFIQRILFFCLGGLLPAILFLYVNFWKFGHPLDTGYPALKYNTPVLEGVFGLLLSSGKGLFWFAPITLIAFGTLTTSIKRAGGNAIFLWSLITANLLFFSRFEIWSGDDAFGPRYMGIVLPLVVVLAAIGCDRLSSKTRWAFSIAGLPASIGGSLIYVNAENVRRGKEILALVGKDAFLQNGSYDGNAIRRFTNFQPQLSQLSAHFTDAIRAIFDIGQIFSYRADTEPFANGISSSLSWYMSRVNLDTWWYYWAISNGPKVMFIGVPLLMYWAILSLRGLLK